jgi:hypothetical protein
MSRDHSVAKLLFSLSFFVSSVSLWFVFVRNAGGQANADGREPSAV